MKSKEIGAKVIVKKLLVEISPKVKWRYLKNVSGVIVPKEEHEHYYHTSTGNNLYPYKHIIHSDVCETFAVKLDDDVVDIEKNNIVVFRDWDLKFIDNLPPKVTIPKIKSRKEIEEALRSSKVLLANFQEKLKRQPLNPFWKENVEALPHEIKTLEWVLNIKE